MKLETISITFGFITALASIVAPYVMPLYSIIGFALCPSSSLLFAIAMASPEDPPSIFQMILIYGWVIFSNMAWYAGWAVLVRFVFSNINPQLKAPSLNTQVMLAWAIAGLVIALGYLFSQFLTDSFSDHAIVFAPTLAYYKMFTAGFEGVHFAVMGYLTRPVLNAIWYIGLGFLLNPLLSNLKKVWT